MHSLGGTEQDGTDGDAIAGGSFEQIESNIRCVEGRHDQQIGVTLKA